MLINAHHWNLVWAVWNITHHISWGLQLLALVQSVLLPSLNFYIFHVADSIHTWEGALPCDQITAVGHDGYDDGWTSSWGTGVWSRQNHIRSFQWSTGGFYHETVLLGLGLQSSWLSMSHFLAGCCTCRVPNYRYIGSQIFCKLWSIYVHILSSVTLLFGL